MDDLPATFPQLPPPPLTAVWPRNIRQAHATLASRYQRAVGALRREESNGLLLRITGEGLRDLLPLLTGMGDAGVPEAH